MAQACARVLSSVAVYCCLHCVSAGSLCVDSYPSAWCHRHCVAQEAAEQSATLAASQQRVQHLEGQLAALEGARQQLQVC